MAQPTQTIHYLLGDLRVDPGQARVLRGDIEIALPKLSFDLLMALIEVAPRIVTTDELMDRVWTGLVVSPETVSQRVSLLRAALGDNPKDPRYVAVVRGRGYRIVAEISRVEMPLQPATVIGHAVPETSGGTTPASEPVQINRRPVIATAAAILGVLLFGAIAIYLFATAHERTTSVPQAAATALPDNSIAVLPFENLGTTSDAATLAPGIAEAVLHQLATVSELTVVARTSSFSVPANDDVRQIGKTLNVRYVLAGSVQTNSKQLRVTATLIDCSSGAQVWSVRLDDTLRDIFAVQDEIALKVAHALKLSLHSGMAERLTGQGTTNFDAYLAYLQGRAHVATLRIADLKQAVMDLRRAIQLDTGFASAYVELADAELLTAEYDLSEDRATAFAAALESGRELVDQALELDPANGHAYVARGYLRAFSDLPSAEADYRRGIELSPNHAKGYAGLAAVLYEDPLRSEEALAALDRARRLDPLEPEYDVTKAVFLFYRRSDLKGASDLLVDVLQRDPLYQPALMRLGEVRWQSHYHLAEAIKYSEQALALDPLSEWTRKCLVLEYLEIGDPAAAVHAIRSAPQELAVRALPTLAYQREWGEAARIAYQAEADRTLSPLDETLAAAAVRMHARKTGDYRRAIELFERLAGVTWDEQGEPHLSTHLATMVSVVALADMLQQQGDAGRARRLAQASLTEATHVIRDLQRGDFWYLKFRAQTMMLLGDHQGALQALEDAAGQGPGMGDWWFVLEIEPLLVPLHDEPRFKRLLTAIRNRAAVERESLEALRRAGTVPIRKAD